MSEYRWEALPRLERGARQWDPSGLPLQLVTIGLLPVQERERGEPLGRAPVLWDLRPSEARELAFGLLELAERAERASEGGDEPA